MQLTLLQQRFSWSLGIGRQTPHLHHSGKLLLPGLGGGGGGAFFSSKNFFAKSKLSLPIAKTFLRRYSMSCLVSLDKNSWTKQNIAKCVNIISMNRETNRGLKILLWDPPGINSILVYFTNV